MNIDKHKQNNKDERTKKKCLSTIAKATAATAAAATSKSGSSQTQPQHRLYKCAAGFGQNKMIKRPKIIVAQIALWQVYNRDRCGSGGGGSSSVRRLCGRIIVLKFNEQSVGPFDSKEGCRVRREGSVPKKIFSKASTAAHFAAIRRLRPPHILLTVLALCSCQ